MARKYIDCREYPSETKCTVVISADGAEELVEVATQHAVAVHKHEDSPKFREMIRSGIKEGAPPA
jgi:hypothetical protein